MKNRKSIFCVLSVALSLCGCTTIENLASKVGIGNHKSDVKVEKIEKNTPVKQEPIGDNIAGEWKVLTVGNVKMESDEDIPYINFDVMTKRVYAYDGCNFINGSYNLSKDNKLTFSSMISTMKYCPESDFQYTLKRALCDTTVLNARFDKAGDDAMLVLNDAAGDILIGLRRHNMSFLNGNWQIESVAGKAVADADATVFFDIPELKIHGNTGCNYFNGAIFVDPATPNAIDFSKMGLTRMACPKASQESAIMLALEQTATAIPSADGSAAIFLTKDGKELMTLKRIPAEED